MVNRAMKDSGVEWIEEVPENWKVTKISRVTTCLDSKRIPIDRGERKKGPFPYWGAGSITDYVHDYLFDEEIILLGEDGAPFFDKSRNVAHLITEKVWVNNHIHVLKGRENVVNNFLVHFLNIVDYGIYVNGSVLNKLTQTNMKKIAVALPSYEEQQKIAAFLDEKVAHIDNIIEDTKKSIENLKTYKESLITETVTKGLNRNVEMKDSRIEGVGEIPAHWNITKLKYILSNEKNSIRVGPFGSHLKNKDFVEEGKWVYNQRTILDNNYKSNNTFITSEKYKEMIAFKVEYKDILLTTRGTIGKISRVPECFEEGIIHSSVIKFKINESKLAYGLLEYLFNESSFIKNQIFLLSNATTIEVIYSNTLKNVFIPVPPLEEQKLVINYLDDNISNLNTILEEKKCLIKSLEKYKKSLIYEYVTGKKEVK